MTPKAHGTLRCIKKAALIPKTKRHDVGRAPEPPEALEDQWSPSRLRKHGTDEATYTKALPDVDKLIKENNGVRVAGGFNKTKLISGLPVGNRYVVLRWDSEEAFTKALNGGIKAWIEKNAPDARQIVVEGVEAK